MSANPAWNATLNWKDEHLESRETRNANWVGDAEGGGLGSQEMNGWVSEWVNEWVSEWVKVN